MKHAELCSYADHNVLGSQKLACWLCKAPSFVKRYSKFLRMPIVAVRKVGWWNHELYLLYFNSNNIHNGM